MLLIMNSDKEISPFKEVFRNELLLDMIFDQFSFRDLKETRCVSKLWAKVGARAMRRKGIIKIYAEQDLEISIARLRLLIQTFEDSNEYFAKNVKLSNWNFDDIPQDLFIKLWTNLGKITTNLKISNVIMLGPNHIRQIISQHAPNLERLVVKNCTFYNPVDDKDLAPLTPNNIKPNEQLTIFEVHQKWTHYKLPIGWNEILHLFPNIKVLNVYGLRENDLNNLFQAMENFRNEDPTKLQLRTFTIYDKYPGVKGIRDEMVKKILLFNFQLDGLTITVGKFIDKKRFRDLIHQQRQLRQLCLITHNKMSEPIADLPCELNFFPNLRYLEITETMIGTMDFLKSTPCLETLSLGRHSPYVTKPTNLDICATREEFVPLKKMKLLHVAFQLTSREIKKLTQWFPQVKQAKLYSDDHNFQIICNFWSQLEELEILGSMLTPIGIIGPSNNYISPNILNLNNLKKFIMVTRNSNIDDNLLVNGFLRMKSLNHLEIFSDKVTEQGWRKVFQSIQIQTFIPTDGNWPSKCENFVKVLDSK